MAATLSLQLDTAMLPLHELVHASPNLEFSPGGSAQLTYEAQARLCRENIARGAEYRRKLAAGEITPYAFVDVRPGGGVQDRDKPGRSRRSPEARARRSAQLIEKKAKHVPARDHVQARLAKDKSATVECYG